MDKVLKTLNKDRWNDQRVTHTHELIDARTLIAIGPLAHLLAFQRNLESQINELTSFLAVLHRSNDHSFATSSPPPGGVWENLASPAQGPAWSRHAECRGIAEFFLTWRGFHDAWTAGVNEEFGAKYSPEIVSL